jgi:hypothetical protein
MTTNALTTDSAPAPGDLERDRKLEVLLDELVTVPGGDELPIDFAKRVLDRRPFAPWEVSRASHWRLPAGIGLGLLAGSLGLALTPLWSLGPATAFTVWTELVAVAFGRPAATLVTAFPLLAEGTGRAAQAVAPGAVVLFGVVAGIVTASLGVALGRLRRPVSAISQRG